MVGVVRGKRGGGERHTHTHTLYSICWPGFNPLPPSLPTHPPHPILPPSLSLLLCPVFATRAWIQWFKENVNVT